MKQKTFKPLTKTCRLYCTTNGIWESILLYQHRQRVHPIEVMDPTSHGTGHFPVNVIHDINKHGFRTVSGANYKKNISYPGAGKNEICVFSLNEYVVNNDKDLLVHHHSRQNHPDKRQYFWWQNLGSCSWKPVNWYKWRSVHPWFRSKETLTFLYKWKI